MKTKLKEVCTTHEFARYFGVTPGTVRKRLCYDGHYFGHVPHKLPNGRLLWDTPGHILEGQITEDGGIK